MNIDSKIKLMARKLIAFSYYLSGRHKVVHQGKVIILMYHRVLNDDDGTREYIQPGMYVTASSFERQMLFIRSHYSVISLNELLSLWDSGTYDKRKMYCVVTFDDGWLDNYQIAYPILKEHDIPATIFLTTSYINTCHWFWPDKLGYLLKCKREEHLNLDKNRAERKDLRLGAYRIIVDTFEAEHGVEPEMVLDDLIERLKKSFSQEEIDISINTVFRCYNLALPLDRVLLDWREVEEMAENNISFGSHTCHHSILINLSLSQVEGELNKSKKLLEEKEFYVPVFCYPNGSYNTDIRRLVEDAGYKAAVTTRLGCESSCPADLYAINRVAIHNDITSSDPLFAFRLSRVT